MLIASSHASGDDTTPKKTINLNGGEKHPHRNTGSYIGNNNSDSTPSSIAPSTIAEYETPISWCPNVSVGAQVKIPVCAGAGMKVTGVGVYPTSSQNLATLRCFDRHCSIRPISSLRALFSTLSIPSSPTSTVSHCIPPQYPSSFVRCFITSWTVFFTE